MEHTCHPIDTELCSRWKLVGRIALVGHGTFVQRSFARGRPWLRLSISSTGWYVTAYRTKRSAVSGDYGQYDDSIYFIFGGENPWGEPITVPQPPPQPAATASVQAGPISLPRK
jgi:hypothetical protein